RRWLAGLAAGLVHEDTLGPRPDGPSLGWVGPRPFTLGEANQLRLAARFAAAPLVALAARATLTVALDAYLGRPSAARGLAGAAAPACWRVRCGAISARPSRQRCSVPICATSPHSQRRPSP